MKVNHNGHPGLINTDADVIEARGNRIVIKVASASQFVGEYSAPEHFAGPPLHVHPGFDETFVVLDGRLEVTVRDEPMELTAGAAAHVSGNVPHTFRNPTGSRVRFLLICTPGGFEDYFRGLAAGDEKMIAAVSERFGYAPVDDGAGRVGSAGRTAPSSALTAER